jgi:hypothetical protein
VTAQRKDTYNEIDGILFFCLTKEGYRRRKIVESAVV